MEKDQIFSDIARLIADCVAKKTDDIQCTSRLIDDIGMDSLDFLDVIFGIEKKFNIKFRNGEFEKLLRLDLMLENNDPDGFVDEKDFAKLKPYLPYLERHATDKTNNLTPIELFSMITVESLVIATQELYGNAVVNDS